VLDDSISEGKLNNTWLKQTYQKYHQTLKFLSDFLYFFSDCMLTNLAVLQVSITIDRPSLGYVGKFLAKPSNKNNHRTFKSVNCIDVMALTVQQIKHEFFSQEHVLSVCSRREYKIVSSQQKNCLRGRIGKNSITKKFLRQMEHLQLVQKSV